MRQIEDERIRFYLRHREQIDEWASLQSEATSEFVRLLEQMQEPVNELAHAVGAVEPHFTLQNSYVSWQLLREHWPTAEGERPPVSVALEAYLPRLFAGEVIPRLYVGIRMPPDGGDLIESFAQRIDSVELDGTWTLHDRWWPVWRFVAPPEGEWWTQLDAYRDAILSELETTWETFAGHVDACVGAVGPG